MQFVLIYIENLCHNMRKELEEMKQYAQSRESGLTINHNNIKKRN